MLQLYNLEHKKLHGLTKYKDARLERELKTSDEKLSFSYPLFDKFYNDIIEESYIRTKVNEYIVKEIHELDDWTEFVCVLNVENLEGKAWDRFESVEQSIIDSLKLAIVGTDWTVGHCDVKKKRTVRKTNCSSWDIIQDIKKTYMVDMQFDCINKKINIYEKLGNDKGVYFIDSLNAKKIETQRDSYEFYTRLIAIGKDGLTISSINNNKDYVENHQYSKKIKTIYWKDDRYTVKENLKSDAIAKLNELSKPRRAYKVDIVNLAKNSNDKYKILDYKLGDVITLISKEKNIKEKQRIVKITEYLNDHSKDTVEIANTILSFEDMQQAFQDAASTVENITNDNGTINGKCVDGLQSEQISDFKEGVNKFVDLSAINADINYLRVNKLDAQDLNVVHEKVGTLEATMITTTQFHALQGQIDFFKSNYMTTHDAEIVNAKVKIIEGKVSNFDEALAGNLTAKNFKANSITAESEIIAENAIGSSQISSLSVNKLDAGEMDTSKINLIGPLRRFRIIGDKLQILDDKNGQLYERIFLGVDENNNSSLILRGADGKTILLNQDGLTNAGFTEGYGRVKDNTLDACKFEKNSIIRQINDATETIKSTKVQIGDRTLDVELSTQNNIVNEHSKELSNQKSSINALDNSIKLKVDNQVFIKTTNTINTAIVNSEKNTTNKAKEYIDSITKKLKEDSEKYASDVAIAKANLAQVNAQAHADNKITEEEKARIKQATENLNTAIAKSKEIEELSKRYANDIAENKKNEAIKNSNAYTNTQITTVNTKVNKATSKLDILENQISSKVSQVDIDKSINNIKLGGRNLILDSNNFKFRGSDYNKNVDYSNDNEIIIKNKNINFNVWSFIQSSITKNLDCSKFYCLSLEIKTNEDIENTTLNFAYQKSYINYKTKIKNTNGKWQRFSVLIKPCNADTSQIVICIGSEGKSLNATKIEYRNIKLEEGNIATDWTPAPEYIEQSIIDSQKSTIEKIDNVSSELNQLKNGFNATVNDLHSKTKTIETNINSAISKAKEVEKLSKNYADKIAEDKKNEALKNSNAYTNTKIKTVETNVHDNKTQLNILKNEVSSKIQNVESKTNSLELKTDKIKNLATAMAMGKMLYPDPTFKVGNNSISTYNNLGNGKVTVKRIPKINDCPTASTHCLEIKTTGQASPWFGGFYFANVSRPNAIFVTRIIAKIPAGRKIEWASNATGDNYKKEWLTSINGTGKWEEYIMKITCGSKGSFSSTNFFALQDGPMPSDSSPLIWYIAYATVFDITENDESINNLKIETSETKNKIAEIKQTTDSLKGSIEQTQVKTKSIENSLKDKVNKNEVKEVSNKVTTVQADLNKISQKISHTESNVSKINENITTFNNKMNSVEQKITPNSLTNIVLSSQQYKNNVNDTNFLREKFTRFQQNTDNFLLNVKNGGTNNLLLNGNFEGNLFDTWEKWGSPSEISILGSEGNKYLKLNINGPGQGLRQVVKVEPNTTYTFSCQCENNGGVISIPQVANAGDYPGVEIKGSGVFSFTFTTKKNDIIFVYLGRGSGGTNGVSRWFWATLTKGDRPCESYIPNANEICGSTININENHIRADYSDGSYSIMGARGFEHWHNGMARPYHYLFYRGSIDRVSSQQTVRINVPQEFKGKNYEISWWSGNVFPQDDGDLIFSANTELINQNKSEGWFDLKASLLVRNPSRENSPNWRGQMNLVYTIIA